MNDTLTVRLDHKLARALQDEAHRTGLSKSEIVREALATRFHAVSKATILQGYAGVIQGPADLSTNKAYRHGRLKAPRR